MKIILFLLLAFVIQVNAKAYSQQRVSLEYENVELSKVMKSLERQTNLYFFFNDKALDTKQRVSVSVENEDLESVLQRLFGDVYDWEIVNNMIVLKPNVNQASGTQQQQLKERKVNGIVKDRRGEPLPGGAGVQGRGGGAGNPDAPGDGDAAAAAGGGGGPAGRRGAPGL